MALDIAKRTVRGSLILFTSNVAATGVNAVIIIIIARLLGPTGYGNYSLALVIPSILQLFIGFGALSAVVRYPAYYATVGKEDEARRFTKNVVAFLLASGAILTVVSFVLADSLSSLILQRPDLGPYVQLGSVFVLGYAIFQAAAISALGWNWMSLSGGLNVSQGLIKLVLAPLLVLVGFGVTGALVGHIASFFIAGTVGVAVLYLSRLRGPGGKGSFLSDVKTMSVYGIPVYAGTVLSGLATYFIFVILARIASSAVYGYYQAAANFTTPIMLLASAMIMALFPAFASIDGVKGDVNTAFRHAYRFVAYLLTPLALFIAAAAGPMVTILLGRAYAPSIPYLQLLALASLPVAFGYSVHPAFFNGFGKTKLTFVLYLVSSVAIFVGGPLLAETYGLGVDGLIYTTFLSYLVAWAVGTFLADRYLHAKLDIVSTGKILLVSAVAYLAVTLLPHTASSLVNLTEDIVAFFGVYLTLTPLVRAIHPSDLDLMEISLSEPRVVGMAASPFIRYLKYLSKLRERRRTGL